MRNDLPRTAGTEDERSGTDGESTSTEGPGSGKRPRLLVDVLVIEDDPDLAELVRKTLAEDAGTLVRVAHDLTAARTAIRARVPDVIVTDLFLPDGHARDLVQELRTHGAPNAVGVVATSGRKCAPQSRGWYDAFLAKPIDLGRLPALVRMLARVIASDEPLSPDFDQEP